MRAPKDYIRSACELHLDGLFVDETDASSWQAVQSFLDDTPTSDQQQQQQQLQHRLFVWLERQAEQKELLVAKASCASFPAQQHYGALCFCHNATDKLKDAHQIQCLTFPPAVALEDEAAASGEEVVEVVPHKTSAVVEALQLYTRHVFVPSLSSSSTAATDDSTAATNLETSVMMLGLQDKLRQLDVALGQCQKTTRLPQVVLVVHPLISQVVAQHPTAISGSNYDWDQLGLSSKLQDDDFLNALQQQVSQWIVQIRKVTVLPQTTAFPLIDAMSNSIYADEEEISFWSQLNVALEGISQEELTRPEVQLTLAMLRQAKRFLATIALENNSGLEQALSHTKDVLNFLTTYPLQQLTSATTLDAVTPAMNAIFDHLPKVRSSRAYDLERCLQLFSATTLTLRRRLETILAQYNTNLILMDFEKYQHEIYFPTQDLFAQFDDRYDRFCQFVVEQSRRSRGAASNSGAKGKGGAASNQLVQSIVLYHRPLQERLESIYEFLRHHDTLRQVVTQVLTSTEDDGEAIRQAVERAPRLHFSSLENVLDTTTSGSKSLESAMQVYDQQMDALEEKLARLLRDKLSACQDAEDMFQVFARFNPLLTRTRVRAAVKEFQMQLITNVGEAIKKLQAKFINKYESSNAASFSRLRGIPPVAGKILWAKQMERQVQLLMTRMENVLGSDWGQQLEGRQLRKSGDELLAKLDARSFFRNWILEWEKELVAASSSPRLLSYLIMVQPTKPGGPLIPAVNFDEKNELLCKEIRYFKWLGLERDIPRTLTTVAEETNDRYPYAMSLKTALRSYQAVRILITPELEPLVMPQLLAIRECVSNAFDVKLDTSTAISKKRRVRWDSKRELADFCNELTELVTKFEERVEQLLRACDKIDIALDLLAKVDYDKAKFLGILNNIQNSIDEMSLAGYASLHSWVSVVDRHLERVFAQRLELALESWVHTLQIAAEEKKKKQQQDAGGDDEEEDPSAPKKQVTRPKVSINIIAVEILLRNQEILSVPAIPIVRSLFLNELHRYMGTVCDLPRPRSGRFEVFDSNTRKAVATSGVDGEEFSTFDNLVQRASSKILADAYSVTEQNIQQVTLFVEQWLAYQALWDTRVSDVVAMVDDDFEKWQALLVETAEARSALDSSATVATFGPVSVKYNKVQSQINLKYDSWQKELQAAFASVLGQSIADCYDKINQAKAKLENVSLESSSNTTENIVLGVTYIQEMKQSLEPWAKEVDKLMSSERLLKLHRHHFRGDWMETSVVKGLHEHLQQILERRTRTVEQQFPLLQARINAEDKAASKRFAEMLTSWEQDKPLRGNLAPNVAMDVLAKYEFTMKKAQMDQMNLIKAKEALGLEHIGETSAIGECLEELSDLKEVWDAVIKPHTTLEQIKDIPWSSAVMRKIKRELDDLLAHMRSMPNRIRQYDAFTHLHEAVKGYISGYGLLSDLKTEALKDRHWKTILERLGIRTSFSELTVGLLWDHGVLSRKKEILEILTVAQGEMALEVFLGQVRDRWMKQELELVLYQNRVRLIRGWDDLFASLDDHMGGLILMRSSPYYRAVREFQEEGKLWEDRLTKLRAAFDAWVDVQRRWVYLEGILFGSSDIKAQLPAEWSRFKSVDGEFVTLMRRIASRPFAMEALNIENLQRTLERLRNLMEVIQRALGEYLEKQRADFSRFYFLGDDDLLEVMGNSGEPVKVLGHVSKMFAGIAGARQDTSVTLPEEVLVRLDAMVSKDGEVVPFHASIDVERNTSVKDWLQQLEDRMKNTLALLLDQAVKEDAFSQNTDGGRAFVEWATKFPAQVMILATQINWSTGVEKALHDADYTASLNAVLKIVETKLEVMARTVLSDHPAVSRKKFEQLITELVHQRDVTRGLIDDGVSSPDDFRWLYHLRYTYNPNAEKLTEKLTISLSNAKFFYGFEYLGIGERLVQTPLTDKCYLTLTQALHFRMGGSPFGPAGTGKTESVKALGAQLGRFVLVFNCDETFDFSAMGRLFAGLSQVGAWGCFDEFNRLEERILSAVSQQILTIQRGLLDRKSRIELLGRSIALHENVGIFITMNPGYAGRSNLPDNLKNLFRSIAMVVPDRNLIAQVMLYSQGIVTAEHLSGKVVDLFLLCEERMSKQSHYDFGLRALKTLLVSAGALKRQAMEGKEVLEGEELALVEKQVLIAGACNNVVPKLVAEDMAVFGEVLQEVFPGSEITKMEDDKLRTEIVTICEHRSYVAAERFIQKVLQLNQVIDMRHGVMVVGPVGSGKTAALQVLLEAMEKVDSIKGEMYVIDPKAIDKEGLYGSLDGTTMEWTDGVFTSLLRRILDNQKGESEKRHWIVFDGDVDPEWAENLNSVLDDNKMLTLPSGERLSLPNNLRIILEVDSLVHTTPATVSRCGMIWFSEDTITAEMSLEHLLGTLAKEDFVGDRSSGDAIPPAQINFLNAIRPMMLAERTSSLVVDALEFALKETHIMTPTRQRLLCTLRSLIVQGMGLAIEYDENHPDFPMTGEHMEKFARRWLLHSLMWSFSGSSPWESRKKFGDLLLRTSGILLPGGDGASLLDYRVRVDTGEYELWSDSVPRMEIESHRVSASDVVITTTDTVRHSDVLGAWLNSRKPLILCGPPGSGKTMTLTSVLQSIQGVVLASLNFSSRTTPDIILKTFSQYCSYVRRGKDVVLEPAESLGAQSWLVVFCDEINLPEEDSYGTQRVIMFMRQLVEQGGFWRSDNTWIKINRIQFVGACNPPTDAGRVNMSQRFLRHVPLLLVDFPEWDSLIQIYRTFNGGMMKLFPNLKGETEAMTEAMVDLYNENQRKFNPSIQPQYFYSPRELSRWVRGIYEAIVNMDQGLTKEELVRIWSHEALRLFADRLVDPADRVWCDKKIDEVARKYFAGVDFAVALARPMFYTTWLSKDTRRVDRDELKDFLSARLRVFYEEELDVPLVVFDEVLEHILRIDRVLRQPNGHLLLVGDSGAGKTVLSKFVSWMNGLNIFQIKAHSRYGMEDFNEDLRKVMRRVGVEGEKVCFIFDESNVLSSGFLEAMNALLASGEVPGLFDGDEYNALMSACREAAARDGVILESEDELWRRFSSIVQRNLHVVFTMNPSGGDWKNRSTTSPALFNRCVIDWFGTWGNKAMAEVGRDFTLKLDMGDSEAVGGTWGIGGGEDLMTRVEGAFGGPSSSLRQAVVAALVEFHLVVKASAEEAASSPRSITRTFLSPRDYLTLIHNFVTSLNKRREEVEDEQLHVNAGLEKLCQTQENVAELKTALSAKTAELQEKESLANKKLQQMVADQNVAEKRKVEAERVGKEVEKQQVEITARKEEAQRDLDDAEPALKSAQASVRGIKKRDLDEVRNLARPPTNVKLTLECVALMLGEKNVEWGEVRKLLSKTDFIPSILNFDADKLSQKQIKLVQEKYLEGNAELTTESVMRSSKACGPLYKWAESQIRYSTVYNRVQPLREEVEQLEKEAQVVRDEKERIEVEVAELELSISRYKTDYASLIRDVEALKSEMTVVSKKVERAESLLTSLGRESERWAKSSENFQSMLRSLVGDGLLLAAFLTYTGFFDFKTRIVMMDKWRNTLDALGIEYHPDLGIVESLSKASDRLSWQAEGLPSDQLSVENAVIIDHCIRFPLVIDPSGESIEFLMNKHREEKIQKTSFLDKAFMKTLAGAVRFGTALLVENVEAIDPVLNPLLNREIQRTGGRSLVRIGTEDVDYSPKFRIILSTKNPAVQLTPDLCSRVTLVNFTVTPASLQSQSLSQIVRSEKPELESRRTSLLKLQGEQNVKLRELEDRMLVKISECEGSILDDDRVVEGMEVLMKEGSQVEEQISKSAEVMEQVHRAVSEFEPFAVTCRHVFVVLEALREISFLYEISASTLMAILNDIFQKNARPSGSGGENDAQRIMALKTQLFHEVAARVGRGLQTEDKIVFSILIARLYKGVDTIGAEPVKSTEALVADIEDCFGSDFPWQGRSLTELAQVTEQEIGPTVPLLLCSAPGHDVSGRVEAMARDLNKELAAVAMGSSEGFNMAESYMESAFKRGTWVMLKNVHLCTDWLREVLVKKLQALGAGTHPDFRIFITSEISPRLPMALLRISDIIVAEAPTGVKASMARFFSSISKQRFEYPVRNRLYLLLAWTHAVIQERLRYVPNGWTEKYEFTEADATHALDVIDTLLDSSGGRQQQDPERLPWDAIRSTLCKSVFGGRVTKPTDQDVLDSLVNTIFVPNSFNVDFPLVNVDGAPKLPDGTSKEECFAWIEALSNHTPPTWIGLDNSAEEEREERIAASVQAKVNLLASKMDLE